MSESNSACRWIEEARSLLDSIEATQMESISTLAEWCADTIHGGGLVHLFGSGHSRVPVEEAFPRYGSFPAPSAIESALAGEAVGGRVIDATGSTLKIGNKDKRPQRRQKRT